MSQKRKNREEIKLILYSFGICFGLGYLFYNRIWTGILLLPCGIFFYRNKKKAWEKERHLQVLEEFQNFINALSNALSAGYSLENATIEGYKELQYLYGKQCAFAQQIYLVIQQIKFNQSFSEAMLELGEKTKIEEILSFSRMIAETKRSGGNLREMIRSCALEISGKIENRREIEKYLNGRKYEQQVMNLVPLGMILYVKTTSYDMFGVLYETFTGSIIMSICLCVYMAAVVLSEKIMQIEA